MTNYFVVAKNVLEFQKELFLLVFSNPIISVTIASIFACVCTCLYDMGSEGWKQLFYEIKKLG